MLIKNTEPIYNPCLFVMTEYQSITIKNDLIIINDDGLASIH